MKSVVKSECVASPDNFCESFAKVAVLLCKRKKGKLRIYVTKVLPGPILAGSGLWPYDPVSYFIA